MRLTRITVDPARMNGQACIRDLRITVRRVLEALRTFEDRGSLFREYPDLVEADIQEALAFAEASLDDKVIDLPKTG